jgi:hypothetical protein
MTKVYIVTSGESYELGVEAVFSSNDLAQEFIDYESLNGTSGNLEIRGFDTDLLTPLVRSGDRIYFVRMDQKGYPETVRATAANEAALLDCLKEPTIGNPSPAWNKGKFIWGNVQAASPSQAISIMEVHRLRTLAEGKWE